MIRLVLAIALALWAGGVGAQVRTDAAGLREIAARLLVQGEAERTRELAQALLERDPEDVTALLLHARASLALGDYETAIPVARRAHGLAQPTGRFLAARIAARAHAELGQFTRAQLWLRRAQGDAPDAEARAALVQDFRAVRAVNPLSVSLSFGVAPTNNVNGGSSEEGLYYLPGIPIPFVNRGDALALSGLRISAGVALSYRIAEGENRATFLESQLQGRTYVLSDEARDIVPQAEGSDYADVVLSGSVAHRWRGEGASGPSAIRATLGHTWYGGEPYLIFGQVTYDRTFALGEDDRLDLSLLADRNWRREEDAEGDVSHDVYGSLGVRGRWTHAFEGGRSNLSLGLRDSLEEVPDVTFTGVTAGVGYDWARPIGGLRLGIGAEVEWRDYDSSGPLAVPDAREDLRGSIRATVGLPELEFYGFEPTVTVEASRTDSDVGRYDRTSLTLDLGLRSTF